MSNSSLAYIDSSDDSRDDFEFDYESIKNEAALNVLSFLNQLRNEGRLCDLTLRVGERMMRVHKIVISACSPYIRDRFSGDLSESDQDEIWINDDAVDAASLELLVDYMYTGELHINTENVGNIQSTASFLRILSDLNTDDLCKNEAALNMLRGLNQLRNEGTLCDLTLRVGERMMRVHKIVISACSSYFMAMFSGSFSESDQEEISINGVDADTLEPMIDYMYTGKIDINRENAKNLLLTATFLQITTAEELCCRFMRNSMDKENCIEYLLFAGNNSIKSLTDMTTEFASSSFSYIFSKKEYLKLEYLEFKQLTERLKADGHVEDLLFSFAMDWIKGDETRISFLAELLKILDPVLISPNLLYGSELIGTSNPIITTWADRASTFRSLNASGECILLFQRNNKFPPMRINILSQTIVGKLESLPRMIKRGSYVCSGYYIYHQGGWRNRKVLSDCFIYHPIGRKWRPFAKLQEGRAEHSSCALNGRIYSVGGWNGFNALPSVEFIDLITGQSGLTKPLPRAKERTGLGIHENSIYVVGGCDRGTDYKCMHRFDAREGIEWEELAPSPSNAGATSCAVIGGSIYTTYPGTLERYDIRMNDWEMISAQCNSYPLDVFAVENTLFGLFRDHTAKFVPEEGVWDIQQEFERELSHIQVSTKLLIPNKIDEDIGESTWGRSYFDWSE